MARRLPSLTPQGFARDERGAALVEFALLLPILLLFFAVTVEGGRMMWSYQAANAGVRDAARFLARSAPFDVCAPGGSLADHVAGLETDLATIVASANSGAALYPGGVTVEGVTSALDCVSGNFRNSPVAVVRVTATVRIDLPFGALLDFGGNGARPALTATISDEHRVFGS
ncbi:TadE/TadG family type IV pilus assembly protein [Roseicyclus sp.]|uniref:TadE/TadG family type IV pilus assembly protein n=1 Tax=Roseicyclus sp. TaxID=1914329 RepID=UPI003FA06FE5